MIFNKGHALLSLRPGTEWSVTDNVLTWSDSTTPPTDDEINAEIARLQAEYDNSLYHPCIAGILSGLGILLNFWTRR